VDKGLREFEEGCPVIVPVSDWIRLKIVVILNRFQDPALLDAG